MVRNTRPHRGFSYAALSKEITPVTHQNIAPGVYFIVAEDVSREVAKVVLVR